MAPAVLLTCHGSVERLDDVSAFLSNIRRGRPTPPAMVEEVQHRLARIGGSPLMRTTHQQAAALSARLGMPVRAAGRLWSPYPAEVIDTLVREGVTTLLSLPLAPHSVHIYHASVQAAAAAHPGLALRLAPPWGLEPALLDACIASIEEALENFPADERTQVPVILSAHSLPLRVIEAGDPYEQQFRAMAVQVAARLPNPSRVAFQSRGMDGGAWLEPDLPTTFAELVQAGARSALIAPIGFVSDHVETLYDLDVEAAGLAREAGLERMARATAMNLRPRFIDALESVARRML